MTTKQTTENRQNTQIKKLAFPRISIVCMCVCMYEIQDTYRKPQIIHIFIHRCSSIMHKSDTSHICCSFQSFLLTTSVQSWIGMVSVYKTEEKGHFTLQCIIKCYFAFTKHTNRHNVFPENCVLVAAEVQQYRH